MDIPSGVASPGNEDGPRSGHDGIGTHRIHRIHRLASRHAWEMLKDLPKNGGLMIIQWCFNGEKWWFHGEKWWFNGENDGLMIIQWWFHGIIEVTNGENDGLMIIQWWFHGIIEVTNG